MGQANQWNASLPDAIEAFVSGTFGSTAGKVFATEHRLEMQRLRHCVALRRMLTAQRVSRLLVRWRCAALDLSFRETLADSGNARHVVEAEVRAEHARVQQSMAWAERNRRLASVLSHAAMSKMSAALGRWREGGLAVVADHAQLRGQLEVDSLQVDLRQLDRGGLGLELGSE